MHLLQPIDFVGPEMQASSCLSSVHFVKTCRMLGPALRVLSPIASTIRHWLHPHPVSSANVKPGLAVRPLKSACCFDSRTADNSGRCRALYRCAITNIACRNLTRASNIGSVLAGYSIFIDMICIFRSNSVVESTTSFPPPYKIDRSFKLVPRAFAS